MPPSSDHGSLEDYDLIGEIGRGNRSTVYKAICVRGRLSSRLLALKKVPQSFSTGDALSTGFSKLQQDLHHPNVLALYSVFFESNVHIRIMEYCPTGNLAEYVGNRGLPENVVLRLLRGLAKALAYLRDRQIIHRAIHPAHIFLDADRAPKLSHFDNAIQLPFTYPLLEPVTDYTAPSATFLGRIYLFIAADSNNREIIEGQLGSFPGDIWSLGSVIYFVFSGQSPSAMIHTALRRIKCSPHLRNTLSSMLDYLPSSRLSAGALAGLEPPDRHAGNTSDRATPFPDNRSAVKQGALRPVQHLPVSVGVPKLRRLSLENLGHGKRRHLLSDDPRGDTKGFPSTRRVVSEPLPFKGGVGFGGAEPPQAEARSPSASSDRPGRTKKPQFIDISCLRPQTHKTKDGCVSILRNMHILVDCRGSPTGKSTNNVMVIDPGKDQVNIFRDLVSQQSLRHATPSARYTREGLPAVFWDQYHAAFVAIEQMKKRTPKLVIYTGDGKYSCMGNGSPADVEASFCLATSRTSGQEDEDETTLRIRYSEEQGLVELRRYTGGADGKVWMKKCITSIFNPKDIPQTEWATLDKFEKDGLAHLIKFSETCKILDDMDLMMCGLDCQGKPMTTHVELKDYSSPMDTIPLLIPRRPNKLTLSLSRHITSKPETSR